MEAQTFSSETFDAVITQDVFEHLFDPAAASREIWRTLKPRGVHLFTTPIYKDQVRSRRVAELSSNGTVVHLEPPEYHGNPVDEDGSLVTFKYGYDITELVAMWAPFDVEVRRFQHRTFGILGEMTDTIIARKRA